MKHKLSHLQKEQIKKWDQKFIWHPFTQMQEFLREEPLIISHGQGHYLFDIDGNKYLDAVSSMWCNVHGHAHPQLNRALREQAESVSHSTLLGQGHISAVKLAKELVSLLPKPLDKVFYSDNGSTAVEVAIKMAYQFFYQTEKKGKRTRLMTFKNAYHGDTLGAMGVGAIDVFHAIYKPLLMENIVANFDNFENLMRRHQKHLCAVIIEPLVQAAGGILLQPPGFLKKLRAICSELGILLIFDEVATAFGRTGRMFAFEHENIVPDIICLSKSLTAGYLPLAATVTSDKIFRAFLGETKDLKTFFHGHTFTGNPLACALALENIKIFKRKNIIRNLKTKISHFKKELKKYLGTKGEIRQIGLIAGIELKTTQSTTHDYTNRIGWKVAHQLKKRGVLMRPLGNTLVLMPPLSITKKEITTMIKAVRRAIEFCDRN